MFIMGVPLLFMTWSWFTTLADLYSDSLIKVLFYIGYILIMFSVIAIKPYMLIMATESVQMKGILYGLGIFVSSWVMSYLLTEFLDLLFDISFFQSLATVNLIINLGVVILCSLGLIIVPTYFILKND